MDSVFHEWTIRRSSVDIPVALWVPTKSDRPYPLVMVGHGGSGHKTSDLVLDAVKELVEPLKIAVLAIDGPVHGARRVDSKDGVAVRQEFRDLWSRGGEVDSMVEGLEGRTGQRLQQTRNRLQKNCLVWNLEHL